MDYWDGVLVGKRKRLHAVLFSSDELAAMKNTGFPVAPVTGLTVKYCLGYPVHIDQAAFIREHTSTITDKCPKGDIRIIATTPNLPILRRFTAQKQLSHFVRLCVRFCLGLPIPEQWLPFTSFFRPPAVYDEKCRYVHGKKKAKCVLKLNKATCRTCLFYTPRLPR